MKKDLYKITVKKTTYKDGESYQNQVGTYYSYGISQKQAINNIKHKYNLYNYDTSYGAIEVVYDFNCSISSTATPTATPTPIVAVAPIEKEKEKETWYQPDLFQFLEEFGSP